MKTTTILLLALLLAGKASGQESEETRIERTRKLILEKGWGWSAGRTTMSERSCEEMSILLAPIEGRLEHHDFEYSDYMPEVRSLRESRSATALQFFNIDSPVFDWRQLVELTPVQNQGTCGSCWAFAAAAQLEQHIKIYDGVTLDISEQHVIDCNSSGYDCDGGWHWSAYALWSSFGALLEEDVPYQEDDIFACSQSSHEPVAFIDRQRSISNYIDNIKEALLEGPVATGISVPCEFSLYTGGVFEFDDALHAPAAVNHIVVIVGWNDDLGDSGAWICRNSWGPGWGDDGYFYVGYGQCEAPSYVRQIEYIPAITITVADGMDHLMSGEIASLSWSSSLASIDSVSISLSSDGGGSFDHPVASGLSRDGQIEWDIPFVHTGNALLRAEAWVDGAIRAYGNSTPFSIEISSVLMQNYPNPFNGSTTIPYSISIAGPARVSVFDLSGRLVRTLAAGPAPAGVSFTHWDGLDHSGRPVASGIYLCRLEARGISETVKIVYLR